MQGGEAALQALARQAGADLLQRLPLVWDLLTEGIWPEGAQGGEEEEADSLHPPQGDNNVSGIWFGGRG